MAMASLTASSSAITLLNKPFLLNRSSFFSSSSISLHRLLRFSASAFIRAVSLESDTSETPSFEIEETQIFACPVYYERLMRKSPHVLTYNQYTCLDSNVDSVTRHTLAKMNTWILLLLLI